MFIVIALMVCGIITGYLLRNREIIKHSGKFVSGAIFLLLFLLGVAVGNNKNILDHLDTIGLKALVVTLAAVLGSSMMAWLVFKYIFKKQNP